jgi:hypothetical protein
MVPVYEEFVEEDPKLVGFTIGVTVLSNLLDRLLPEGTHGIIGVLRDTCGNVMSFELSDSKAKFLGYKDVHESQFDEYERFEPNIEMYKEVVDGLCVHDLHIYPSSNFSKKFISKTPVIYTTVVGMAFVITAVLLAVYDRMVNRRQSKTMMAATRTQAIITSLFPKEFGRKLVQEAVNGTSNAKHDAWRKSKQSHGKAGLQSLIGKNGEFAIGNNRSLASSKPLADLFPEATIMFGDLVGFTAWSSSHEPSQVFRLLEGVYSSFDEVALRRKVFKVETGTSVRYNFTSSHRRI